MEDSICAKLSSILVVEFSSRDTFLFLEGGGLDRTGSFLSRLQLACCFFRRRDGVVA